MFANLKNKLIEEVKASPSKFQQLAQQAQAAVSSSTTPTPSSSSDSAATSTTTTNENFFSITEEDTPQNTPLRLPFTGHRNRTITPQTANGSTGAIPRTRKLSNSSMASDVSFRLPSFDAAPATYHLQSDLESEYGSEFGDDFTSPAKLEVISKEKLFEAYKRSLERYNKYRCRYTDLVKQYKELERDSSKARAVLIETQDKALRRINELREQCVLEQGAKAHLEQALRVEMDDMKCKIQAYETKLKLLGENPESIKIQNDAAVSETLIDLDSTNDAVAETLNGSTANEALENNEHASTLKIKINELELELKNRDEKLKEMSDHLAKSRHEIEQLKKQEEENSLLLAQTKQAIHTELESKENEVKKLKNELKQLAAKKDDEKSSELKDLREKLKQAMAAKQEVDAKLIASDHLYSELKEQQATNDKSKLEAAERLREHEQKIQDLRQQNTQLNEMLQRYQQNEVSLAEIDNELNRTKNENDNLRAMLEESSQKLNAAMDELKTYKEECDKQKAQLQEHDKKQEELQQQVTLLTQELTQLRTETRENEQETLTNLRAKLEQTIKTHEVQLAALQEQLNGREKELKTSGNKVAKQKKQHETQQNKIKEQNVELEKLREELNQHAGHLQMLQSEATAREQQTETEKTELKSQITSILQEIKNMEVQLHEVQQSHAELEQEKRQLEEHIKNLQEENEEADASRHAELEKKLQNIEVENSQLAERNCLLTENVNRLEKQLAEKERQQTNVSALESELRAKLETAEDALQRLNEKMAQVLDENSRMQNTQELMDHDHRTLQDKCDALEKEKLMAEDELRGLQSEIERLTTAQQQAQEADLSGQLENLRQQNLQLNEQLTALENVNETNRQLQTQLEQQIARNVELMELDNNHVESIKEKEKEIEMLKAQFNELEIKMLEYVSAKEELELVLSTLKAQYKQELGEKEALLKEQTEKIHELQRQQNESSEELRAGNEQQSQLIAEKTSEIEKLREQMSKNARERIEEHESLKQELTELIELEHRAVEQLEEGKAEHMRKIAELELRLQAASSDIENLHENNVAYQVEIEQLQSKHQTEVQELTTTLRRLQDEHTKLQTHIETTKEQAKQITDYEQLKIENEYLNKHVKQIEQELESKKGDMVEQNQAINELKEKLKSLQCELYVLKENAEAHQTEQKVKEDELANLKEVEQKLKTEIETQAIELKRQTEHADYVTQQNDSVQKDLLHMQQQLQEKTLKLENLEANIAAKQQEIESLQNEHKLKCEENEALNLELDNSKSELQALKVEQIEKLQATEVTASTTAATKTSSTGADAEHLRELNAKLQLELEELKHSSTAEITHLQHEIEDLKNNVKHGDDRIMELEIIRAGLQAQKLYSTDLTQGGVLAPELRHEIDHDDVLTQNAELEAKLKEIMNEVHEVSNRNIFLEQQCENYLILEQSNERLKLQNAKLSRQLDETLVSMQHNEGMNANTEFEYLRNIMFQYFTGSSNGNNETLVKVISAVLKFSPQQTQVALEKEHQRRSLLNKIL